MASSAPAAALPGAAFDYLERRPRVFFGWADRAPTDRNRQESQVSESDGSAVTLRCGFCGTLNKVDLKRAEDRPQCGECTKPMLLDRPVKVAQEDFERTVLRSGVPVLVDFYADWCAPCRMVAPLVDEIAYQKIGRMLVVKVDTDHAPEVAMKYEIRSIPTLILFDGGEERERSIGFEPERVRSLVEGAVA